MITKKEYRVLKINCYEDRFRAQYRYKWLPIWFNCFKDNYFRSREDAEKCIYDFIQNNTNVDLDKLLRIKGNQK
jgi:hypothetical protein